MLDLLTSNHSLTTSTLAFGKRVLLSDFRLSDGTLIPKGSYVCCPLEAVTHDPAHYPDPDTFDGYRHYRLRQKGGFTGDKHQWVSTSAVALSFGYGRHSCPGRFLATMEIKILVAQLLMGWDFAVPEGERAQTITRSDFVRVLLLSCP